MSEEKKHLKPVHIIGLIVLLLLLTTGIFIGIRYAGMKTRTAAMPTVDILAPEENQPAMKGVTNLVSVQATGNGQGVDVLEWYLDGILSGRLEGEEDVLRANWEWLPDHDGTFQHSFLAYAKNGAMGMASQDVAVISGADVDGDGVPDAVDECPSEPGPAASGGCALPGDEDADGLMGEADACPDAAGSVEASGCPSDRVPDSDADGIADAVDRCPDESGRTDWDGCPLSAWAVNTDGDELPDFLDDCPEGYGPRDSSGCPTPAAGDTDGDGIADAEDACADSPGSDSSFGCPLEDDRDGDGIMDASDACPDEAGPAGAGGCPPDDAASDADMDGVPDAMDGCPEVPGLLEYGGCPMPDDRDGDGVADADDRCADLPGSPGTFGCPLVSFPFNAYRSQFRFLPFLPLIGEKSPDEDFAAPPVDVIASITSSRYIPQVDDLDGDGVLDGEDDCKTQVGRPLNNGCPLPGDRDSDGRPDTSDPCSEFNGSCQSHDDIRKIVIDLVGFRSEPSYAGLYCYGWTNGYANYVRMPQWEYLGSILDHYSGGFMLDTRFIPADSYISLHLYCWGQPEDLSQHSRFLGGLRLDYHDFFWDGQIRKARARGPGGMFEIWLKIRQLSYAIT